MDLISKLLDNVLFVGIVGGTISGLVVFVIIFSSRKEIEYQKDVLSANQEIVQAVKVFFIQKQSIDRELVSAMIAATATKYNLKEMDLFNLNNIADFLIKEIMETGFLSVENKKELCDLIYKILKVKNMSSEIKEIKATTNSISFLNKEVQLVIISMALMVAVVILISSVAETIKSSQFTETDNLMTMTLTVLATILAAGVSALIVKIKKRKH